MNQVMTFINSIPLRTWIWIGIGVLLLILIILWIRSGRKPDNKTTIVNNTTIPPVTSTKYYGSNGEWVKKWQTYLKSTGANLGTTGPNKDGIDGIWGPLTEAASLKVANLDTVIKAYIS